MPERTIDVAEIIDQSPLGAYQIRIFVLCALVTLLDGFDAQSIAFTASAIAKDLQVPVSTFGPIFGAGTIGLALGAIALPPLADRYGRRYQIIIATLIFGLFSFATAWVNSFAALAALRFLAGIGIGAAVPNVVPLVSEFAPRHIRAALITAVAVSWPLGAVLGGLISAKLIPTFGWQSVFYVGGAAPILLALVLLPTLPESVRFMATKDNQTKNITKVLTRIAPDAETLADARFVLSEEKLHGLSIGHLFSSRRAAATLLLWVAFFMNFVVLFFIFNWLPPLMQQAGFSVERAIIATVVFNFGGIVGGITLGRLMDKFGNYAVVGLSYALGALFVGLIGFLGFSITLLMATVLLAGFCTVGTQACGNALAASLYPTTVRSTGVGWAYGIGRIGSIVGPIVGGLLLTRHWEMRNLLLISAVPLLCAAVAVFLLSRTSGGLSSK
jgi:AAHS family 4-hydroxybenzoate transporter-like MFS transporter